MIYLIRHGITNKNKSKVLISQTDDELNELGLRQAEKAAISLEKKNISKIFCSPLKRTIQTATPISNKTGINILVNNCLRERYLGIYENLSMTDLINERKKRNHFFNDPTQDWNNVEEVEKDENITDRVFSYLTEFDYQKSNIAIFTHAGVIKSILYHLFNIPPTTFNCFKIRYGTIVEIDFPNTYPQILSITECHVN